MGLGFFVGVLIYAMPTQWQDALSRAISFPKGFEDLSPVPASDLADMRGGLLLPNGMVVNFAVEFRTVAETAQGSFEEVVTVTSLDNNDLAKMLDGNTGVINKVTVDQAGAVDVDIEPTSELAGFMNHVLNNSSGSVINHSTSLTADLNDVLPAVTAAAQASRISDAARASTIMSIR